MAETLRPESPDQVAEAVRWAAAEEVPLEVVGRGSKRGFGRPVQAAHNLDLGALSGITFYEPAELILSARAGTPLVEIEAALAENGQQLAFEPADLGPLLGQEAGRGSIGGVIACNLSGPRRLTAGAARDHFLGVTAVSGRGEAFKSGGRVVKNVTGYDLCKLLAGSHGTLAVMTELTLKVLPAPEKARTALVFGLDDAAGLAAMTQGLGGPFEVTGAAHLPPAPAGRSRVSPVAEAGAGGRAVTALRLEGPGPSVTQRCRVLREALADLGDGAELHSRNSQALWSELRDLAFFQDATGDPLWRISVPPQAGPQVAALVAGGAGRYLYDWAGGLVWLALPEGEGAGPEALREAVAGLGGHATLVRAPEALRTALPVFQPLDAAQAQLSRRVKESFDPRGILNPGRMYPGL